MNREIENVLAKFFGSTLGGVLPHENVRLRNICGLQSRAKLSHGSFSWQIDIEAYDRKKGKKKHSIHGCLTKQIF